MTYPDEFYQLAEHLITTHVEDLEYLSVGEMMETNPFFADMSEEDFDSARKTIYDLVYSATIVISWPERNQGVMD